MIMTSLNLPTYAIQLMSELPRFGHGSEISKLASSKREEQTDYVVGILAVSFFIICLFVFWAAAIAACNRMGEQRVGLCAGRMRVECDGKGQINIPAYQWTIRCTFVFFGCCMCVLCTTLAGPGLASTKTTSNSIRKLSRDVNDLIAQGMLILDSVERVKWGIDKLDVQSILMVGEACPNSTYMSGILSVSTIKGIDEDFDRVKLQIQNIDLEGIRRYIDFVVDGTDHAEIAVTTFEENDWIVKMFLLVLGGLTLFTILGACSSWSGVYRYIPALTCMLDTFILPTFVLANICCWVAASALVFASIFNSDFCSGNSLQSGPAGTVMKFFEERGISSNDVIITAFTYYQSGCLTDDPIIELYQYEDYLQSGISWLDRIIAKVHDFYFIEKDKETFCGTDLSPLIEHIRLVKASLELLLSALRSIFELASCSKMSTLYKHAFEEVACTDSLGSFALLFLIMFTMGVVGLVLLMLRAALYPCKMVLPFSPFDEEKYESEEYRAYLQDDNIALSTESTVSETSSEATRSIGNIGSRSPLNSSTILLSPSGPVSRSNYRGLKLGCMSMKEDEEKALSSPDSRFTFDQSRMHAPSAYDTSAGDNHDVCTLFSSDTSMRSSEIPSRHIRAPESPHVDLAKERQTWLNMLACFVLSPRVGDHTGDKSE